MVVGVHLRHLVTANKGPVSPSASNSKDIIGGHWRFSSYGTLLKDASCGTVRAYLALQCSSEGRRDSFSGTTPCGPASVHLRYLYASRKTNQVPVKDGSRPPSSSHCIMPTPAGHLADWPSPPSCWGLHCLHPLCLHSYVTCWSSPHLSHLSLTPLVRIGPIADLQGITFVISAETDCK